MPSMRPVLAMLTALSIPVPAFGVTFTTPIELRFVVASLITRDDNGDGLPEHVEVGGTVIDDGEQVGTFAGVFEGPEFVPLPEALEANPFGIPPGTVMPAWIGPVDYDIAGGRLSTSELAFIFPDDAGKLVVLSTAEITGGTGSFRSVTGGGIITPDGYDGLGSLQGEVLSSRPLPNRNALH